ncbi:DeoR/GlpR family DNA-binding transcription regulator [Peribacillus frigoritolerans]|uniref:DeoR/GlpR family DNA-binding transcription regulator n=1 Tax=Peribacillus frigoritolerans TaxID=450367 RepID=UPI0021D0FFC5|nr:DeoR/GlpR family DNA-binding transcription regulator [Peribacillus frigoritolerans]MCU6603444.1 DeoR/GlpR family DNA-binding transcription regulator [Peribacillus frigoritolerans]
MLITERHQLILKLLKEKGNVKIHELVELTNTSESTLRRDLDQLEKQNYLKRVHGGASLLHSKRDEPSVFEKITQNLEEKAKIAKYAAELILDGDCVYLDAGTTTYQMIKHLRQKDIVVITNGIDHLDALLENDICTYFIGGFVKKITKATVGRYAYESIKKYRFDKCFMGANAIHYNFGLTTPDPEEAQIKERAIFLSREAFVLADHTKFGEVSFSKFADLNQTKVITNEEGTITLGKYKEKTEIIIVRD